ncbi:hypothetical protein ACTXT7_006591 [Hymenolepis weldensis]
MRAYINQVLDYSWDFVTSLFWARYPNPYASHVLHEDVLERYLIDENKLYTKRLLVKKGFGHIPFWLRKILSNRQELIMEESIIDLEKKEILTSTRNFGGLSNYAVLVENCRYAPSQNDSNATAIARHVELKSALGTRVLYPLWSYLNRRYANSADKSLKGYQLICQQFAGEIGSNPITPIKLASRLKEFALKKRPRVMRAQADCDDLD